LREFEARYGFETIVVEPVEAVLTNQSVVRVSSSLIRWLLSRGRVQDAARLLGRPYEIDALIQRGDQRGRTLGFPTANLGSFDQLLPAEGIYAGIAQRIRNDQVAGKWPAAISVGTKPTFGDNPRTCEAHLLDYDGPVNDYDWSIRLHFTHWLRDQLTYPNVDALIAQLHRDVAAVRQYTTQSPGILIPATAPRGHCERTT
jgi:riboflavin kinase/FMN adenylyltransferase